MEQWYKQSKWRNLVDMHIPDWNPSFMNAFDPERYAGLLAASEADCAIFYSGNCLGICFWPTKAGHMHRGLKGRDIVGETLRACREKGMKTIIYFNIWNRHEFDRHPDWRLRYIDGRDTTRGLDGTRTRYGNCCLNSPPFRSFVRQQIEDLIEHYPFDGLWIDMIGWNGTICYCPACRKRYHDETGREIPEVISWYDPDWVRFQRKREEWFADFTRIIDHALRASRPDATVAYQCGSSLGGWIGAASQDFLSLSDYLAGDFDSNGLTCSTICKILSATSRNRPIEFMTARCVSLADHTTIKSYQQFRQNVYVALARNSAFCFIDAIDPAGTLNARFYKQMGVLHREMKPYQDEIAPDATLLRDVSVYFNLESGVDVSMNGKHISLFSDTIWGGHLGSQLPRLRRIAKALISRHLAFDIAAWNSRTSLFAESKVILVPNQLMLDDQEIEAMKAFVQAGGSLILTARTGYCDKNGQIRQDGALSALTGVHLTGETAEDVVYLRPAPSCQALFASFTPEYPLSVPASALLVRTDPDVEILAYLTLPYSHSQEIVTFGSAISNPPGHDTDYPAITLRHYGRGKVLYLAAPVEDADHEAQQELLCNLVRMMIGGQPILATNAPAWLEILVYKDESKNDYLIYACKTMDEYHEMTAEQITLSLRLPEKTGVLRRIPGGERVQVDERDGRVSWTEAEIGDFAMYRLAIVNAK